MLEFEPAVFDFLRDVAGAATVERFRQESFATNNFGNYCRVWYGQFLSRDRQRDERRTAISLVGSPYGADIRSCRRQPPSPALCMPGRDRAGFHRLVPDFRSLCDGPR